ncbi:MAG: pH regulation protein F [Alphaproteobacteria bacterium CG11_big_fil_rev_8_21_14_0_20_44_7]|nr:MAG: pH regulation protein F [Alphaproteobacteria bacterium CG11_big_fil_rev_8_21_14_0_20_44_7]
MLWLGVIIFLCVSMILLLMRAILGPSVFDRILASNLFTTNVVLLIVALAFIKDNPSYIDVALVYAFLNFVATIGFLRFFKYGTFRGTITRKQIQKIQIKAKEKQN